jgi:hypothetical protein
LTKAYLDKLTNFPKIGFKENKKLQIFGDLLELQCAKEDGRFQGLRILDEPIYLKPVLTKLPGDIQTTILAKTNETSKLTKKKKLKKINNKNNNK